DQFSTDVFDNRYFQWSAILETDDAKGVCDNDDNATWTEVCSPEIEEVDLRNRVGGIATGTAIERVMASEQEMTTSTYHTYTELFSFTHTEVGDCHYAYQLSPDGVNYYYYDSDSESWILSTIDIVHRNSMSEVNSGISKFSDLFGAGSVSFKAFIKSDDGEDECRLEDIQLEGVN
ncbi:MAG: hypothetical protein ACPGJV_16270, partial [Bacteriovoracaceae bacterium]